MDPQKKTSDELTTTSLNKADIAPKAVSKMEYGELKECVDRFFADVTDFESKEAYKRGYVCTVGEDLGNTDLLCNIYDLVYNHCMTSDLSTFEKKNLKCLCDGIQQINKSISQYNDRGLDKVLVSTLIGYILKITRNYFHD